LGENYCRILASQRPGLEGAGWRAATVCGSASALDASLPSAGEDNKNIGYNDGPMQ